MGSNVVPTRNPKTLGDPTTLDQPVLIKKTRLSLILSALAIDKRERGVVTSGVLIGLHS